MKFRQLLGLSIAASLFFLFGSVAMAQTDPPVTPNVQISEAGIVDGSVSIVRAVVTGPGWVVIHADNNGRPGAVLGYAPLDEGENNNISVDIDADAATPILHAMLHVDAGAVGTYEFPGADEPVMIEDDIVMAKFSAAPPIPAEAEEETAVTKGMAANMPATMPVTGAGTSAPLIFAVVAVVLVALGGSIVFARRHHA